VKIQGELKTDGVPIDVNSCTQGAPPPTGPFDRCTMRSQPSQMEVYFTLPVTGPASTKTRVSMCHGPSGTSNVFDSIMEILWCPSNAPGATFYTGVIGMCFNDDGPPGCGALSQLIVSYPLPGASFMGYIPIIGIGNYPNWHPVCGEFKLSAVELP
jgi:hypothetical protein